MEQARDQIGRYARMGRTQTVRAVTKTTKLDERMTWEILSNPRSSEEELSQLYGSRKYAVMEMLATHPNTSDEKLLELAKLGKPDRIYERLARRDSLSTEAQLEFYRHDRYLLLVNAHFPVSQEVLRTAILEEDEDNLELVLTFHQLDAKNYELLAKRVRDEGMSRAMLVNQQHCPRGDVEHIVASVADDHRWGYECMTLYKAVNNPNLSGKAAEIIMDKAFAHRDRLLAERVAEHDSFLVSAAALARSGTSYPDMRSAIDRGLDRHRTKMERQSENG